ncbi:MAG: GAF and ANTAR domain-containing protein [Actinomycetota bacterium]|nr:GAF and ANTAR domain-containing protein [Actinomycetota bacterium]
MSAEMDLRGALLELSRFIVTDAPLPVLMERIAATAKEVMAPVAEASVTFTRGGSTGWTVATTGDLATQLDEAQYGLGQGPCMDAASGGETLLVRDFAEDDRWPDYAPVALRAGARSSLSVPLPVQQHVVAALNLYSREVDAFTDEDVALAQDLASVAAVAVTNAALYESAAELASQLEEAMRSRAVIEQAKGVIMAHSHCGADRAFDILVKASQRENRKLRDIAAEIVGRCIGSGS